VNGRGTTPAAARPSPLWPALIAAALGGCWLLAVLPSWRLSPDLGHSFVAPLLIAYLWWERWDERPAAGNGHAVGWLAWVGLAAALALAAAMRLFLTPFPLWPALLAAYTALCAALALAGAWLIAGRPGVRWLGGPLILLVSALPLPSSVDNDVIIPLRRLMAQLTAEISNLIGQPALASGTSVRLASDWVGIEEACGGIRSLQACLMIALFFGEWYRFRPVRRLVLVLAGFAAALAGNFGRVLFLSLLAGRGHDAVAGAHDAAGWVGMGASLAGTAWFACHLAGYRWPERAAKAPARAHASLPLAAGWRWLGVAALGLVAAELGTRAWYAAGAGRRASIPTWTAQLPENSPTFGAVPLAESSREMLRPDIYRAGHWTASGGRPLSAYYIEWRHGQVARTIPFLHNPTVCLPYAGCELVAELDPIEVPWSGGTIPFHAYRFRQMGEEILVAFTIWDPARGASLAPLHATSEGEWWRTRWAEVRDARQDQPGQLLTVTIPWSNDARTTLRNAISSMIISDSSY
jgi:exosortase